MAPIGEPTESPKPQPLGHFPSVLLFTTVTLCFLFVLWRRANALRTVVAHQLKTWSQSGGDIRLSEDDGPPAHTFLEDEDVVDSDELADGVLALHHELTATGTGCAVPPPPLPTPASVE